MKYILFFISLFLGTSIFAQEIPNLKEKDGKYALLDENNTVISDYYSAVYDFEAGFAIVRDFTKFGAIDKTGAVVIPVEFNTNEIKDEFINYLEKYIEDNPDDEDVLIFLGTRFLNTDTLKALEYYDKALSIEPDNSELYVKIGDRLFYVNQQKAIKYYEKALSIEPDSLELCIELGDKILNINQQKALEYYKKALSIEPDNSELYKKIGDILFNDNQQKALEYYEKALSIEPQAVNLKEKFRFINGIAAIKNKDGKYGVIDSTGKLLTTEWYEKQWTREKNIVIGLKKDDKWTMINNKGVIFNDWYSYFYIFSEGLCFVQKEEYGKWGVINEEGELVINYQFDEIEEIFEDGKAKVEKDGETFWINKKGERIDD